MKQKPQNKKQIGKIGEDIACRFLMKRGFIILQRNYLKKWGEIDIIVMKSGTLHFIEVKTVTRVTYSTNVIHETSDYRAEDNLDTRKLKRLSRVIQTYLSEKGFFEEKWQLDAVIVILNMQTRRAKVRFMNNIVI